MENDLNPSTNVRRIGAAFGLFVCFAFLYTALRSNDIFGTDGAHRCLVVFRRQAIFFHENSHLLYPVNVLLWTKLAGAVGIRPNEPFAFYKVVELMNCFAAAASVAMVFLFIQFVVSSVQLSLGCAIALGLSKALFVQATNANEAVVGLFWSLGAMLVLAAGLAKKSDWIIFVSGLLFSLSMVTYESMIFLAPAALLLIWQTHAKENSDAFLSRPVLSSEGSFLAGCAAASLGIHAWADWVTGVRRPPEMVTQLFQMRDARSYLGITPGKILGLPIGMIRNVYPVLTDFVGLRHVPAGPRATLAIFLLVASALGTFVVACAARLWSNRRELSDRMRIGLIVGLVGLASTLVPLLIWDPQYEKLWLQPLAVLVFLIAIALKTPVRGNRTTDYFVRIAAGVLLASMFVNFPPVISVHRADVLPYFQEARDVYQRVRPKDLVIVDWGKISILYGDVWAPQDRYVDFISEAVYHGRGATDRLRGEISEAKRRGGRVYFLGLLDESESQWNGFLGSRCGVPFSDLEPYRKNSHTVVTFSTDSTLVSMRQLDLSITQ